jgi:predicted O-methyltransferase YrrM
MESSASPAVPTERKSSRYSQLAVLIALVKPRTIVEVGTNRGDSAVAMCLEALKHRRQVHYMGFDVFDTRDEEFHRRVFNAKRVMSRQAVHDRLESIRTRFPAFTFELIEGETSSTLHQRSIRADFVFIDGDHRTEMIGRDYAALAKSDVIVFDDFYDASSSPGDELTRNFGCNQLIATFVDVSILPIADSFPATGPIRMAVKIRKRPFFACFGSLLAKLRATEQ